MDRFQNSSFQSTASNTSRRTIATYTTYADAQKAVDYLSDNKFAVEKTAIVAEGLRFVEQVTGRLNWGRVIANGAGSGALTGVLIGLFFGLLFRRLRVCLDSSSTASSSGLSSALSSQ